MLIAADNVIYDELFDVPAAITVKKGDAAVVQDVLAFAVKDAEEADEEVVRVYRCRQVIADKKAGSGEEIEAGDRLYFYPATADVSPNKVGTYGVDYMFCGWAKRDAGALEATVLMNFDGTRYDENL